MNTSGRAERNIEAFSSATKMKLQNKRGLLPSAGRIEACPTTTHP